MPDPGSRLANGLGCHQRPPSPPHSFPHHGPKHKLISCAQNMEILNKVSDTLLLNPLIAFLMRYRITHHRYDVKTNIFCAHVLHVD